MMQRITHDQLIHCVYGTLTNICSFNQWSSTVYYSVVCLIWIDEERAEEKALLHVAFQWSDTFIIFIYLSICNEVIFNLWCNVQCTCTCTCICGLVEYRLPCTSTVCVTTTVCVATTVHICRLFISLVNLMFLFVFL